MTTINFLSAVSSRSRALSTPAPAVSMWRDRFVVSGTSTRLVDLAAAHHNSMISLAEAGCSAEYGVYGTAKQAAPPRGIPR